MHYAWVNRMSTKWLLERKNVMSLFITSYIYYYNKEYVPKVTLPKSDVQRNVFKSTVSQHIFGIQGNTAELNEHGREAYGNTLYEVETGF
jgi:hypothetical protein